MSALGGLEQGAPDEGVGGGSEQASEAARSRFAQSQQTAAAQQRKDEQKAKKRDDSVAKMILRFLKDAEQKHLVTVITQLVSRDCPSTFLIAILSLINEQCRKVVDEYLAERGITVAAGESSALAIPGSMDPATNALLIEWITRMESVLNCEPENIISSLLIDAHNIDGTVLQLCTFCLQLFLGERNKAVHFDNLQQLTVHILQPIFLPHMETYASRIHAKKVMEQGGKVEE